MVYILGSGKGYEKLKQELSKYQIEVFEDSNLVLVERGHDIQDGTLAVVFDAIDYMDVINLLASIARKVVYERRCVIFNTQVIVQEALNTHISLCGIM